MTLIELLVVLMVALIVFAAGLGLLQITMGQEPERREQAGAIQQARVMVDRLSRELRQGFGVQAAEPDRLVLLSYVKRQSCGGADGDSSIDCQITYQCGGGACTRTERNTDGSGAGGPVEVVSGTDGQPVFSYSPSAADPDYVGIRLSLPAETAGEDAITLVGGVALRNAVLGGD